MRRFVCLHVGLGYDIECRPSIAEHTSSCVRTDVLTASVDPCYREVDPRVSYDILSIAIIGAHKCHRLPVQFSFEHNWMRAGAVGLAAFTLATILSIRPIRHAAFEFFLISHIILIA